MSTVGVLWRCAVCGAELDAATAYTFRCPRAGTDPHHVLHPVPTAGAGSCPDDPNPFVRYAGRMAWWAFAEARGLGVADRLAIVRDLDAAIATVDGRGFSVTPFGPSAALTRHADGPVSAPVWVKDETGNVSGSHKARHAMGSMLHLLIAERVGASGGPGPRGGPARPPLAIASCGNAALAAAVVAAAARWPLQVFVPPEANPAVLERLEALGAQVVTCARRAEDPPGDPCVLRCREAVAAGALPFGVQGPDNALALDGGRTLGWELAEGSDGTDGVRSDDAVFVQVGGGALATGVVQGLADAGVHPELFCVQAAGCAPLARAWGRMGELGLDVAGAAARWERCMWPWADPHSVAGGILDDETYDWLGIVAGLAAGGGRPLVVAEDDLEAANQLAHAAGLDADHTGSAALAGLVALTAAGPWRPDRGGRAVVLVTGVRRR